ncbi:MAG TPA: hypothetical protein PKD26_02440 [Pyrinomonadaceae bacterium]|nr:hypothetical protein [Pyrinomonadaceae bacterium]
MSKKYHIRERCFLNKKIDMRAYVMAIVEDTREIADSFEDGWKWGEIELKLADCFDEVSFEFNLSTRADRENSLFKIRKIAEVVTAVKEAIEIEADDIECREAIKPLFKALAVH